MTTFLSAAGRLLVVVPSVAVATDWFFDRETAIIAATATTASTTAIQVFFIKSRGTASPGFKSRAAGGASPLSVSLRFCFVRRVAERGRRDVRPTLRGSHRTSFRGGKVTFPNLHQNSSNGP